MLEPLERRALLTAVPHPVFQNVDPIVETPQFDRVIGEEIAPGLTFERKHILPPPPQDGIEPVGPPNTNPQVSGILDPNGPTTFDIIPHYGPDILLPANAAAKAAFDNAIAFWESVLSDPVTVEMDADFTGGFGAGVAGSTTVIDNQFLYTDLRTRMIDDAAPNESIVNSLPIPTALTFSTPPTTGVTVNYPAGAGNVEMSVTRANARALGFNKLTPLLASAYSPGSFIDGTIKFNSALASSWDFDPSNGITAGLLDFQGAVTHEIGHLLGFVSVVDTVDLIQDGFGGIVFPYSMDLFRLAPNQGGNFSTAPRILNRGTNVPIQVFHDGQFNVAPFAGVDLNEDGMVNGADAISTGDIPFSTGGQFGDGRQASHWKRDEFTGVTIGIMDPTLAPGQLLTVTQTDLRVMGLIGWDVHYSGIVTPAGPTVAVNSVTTNDTTPALSGTVTQSGANARIFVEVEGQFGQNSATLLVDGDSLNTDAFVLTNSASSANKITKAQLILHQSGLFQTLFPPTFHHFNTSGANSLDFDVVTGQAATVGLLSPQDDSLNDADVHDFTKVLTMTFNDFNPGESMSWRLDMDPGTITGDLIAGSTLIVYFDNGLSSAAVLTAIGAGNPDASQATVTMNRAFEAVNNGNGTWTLPDNTLPALVAGTYSLKVVAFDESEARAFEATMNELVIDTTAPTVDVVDVTPDPRNTSVSSIAINFSEAVQNFDISDITLTLNGGPNLLPGGATLNGSGANYTLDNLTGLTGTDGTYVLTVNVSNIQDLAGNALAASANDTWVKETVAPTVDVVDVTPDPRNTSVSSIAINFSEAVQNFDISDITLTLNGGPNLLPGGATLNGSGANYTLDNLTGLTGTDGTYVLTVNTSNIQDLAGNALAASANDTWVKETVAPTVDVVDVTPDPRATDVSSIAINFSEAVQNFDISDITLTLNGGPNLLPGGATLNGSGANYTLDNLTGLTGTDGTYVLTVNVSDIQDLAGNALAASANDTWVRNSIVTVSIDDVLPDPRSVSTLGVTIAFSHAVQNFDLTDLTLTLNGGPNLLPGSASLVDLGGQQTWSLRGIHGLTSTDGTYVLTVNTSDIQSLGGVPLSAPDSETWVKQASTPVNIVGSTVIQAEDMARRVGAGGHEWWIVNSETAGVGGLTGATGPSNDFVQSLNLAGADTTNGNGIPAGPYVDYDINVSAEGNYDLNIRGAGLNGSSDSLWIEILGANLVDPEGRTVVSNALYVITPSTGGFTDLNAGIWRLGIGVHTVRVWMRESGTAVDSITIGAQTTTINGITEIQAESFSRRVDSAIYKWWIVDAEMPGVGGLSGATGPFADFIQPLTMAGADTPNGNGVPALPYIDYDINVPSAGNYYLDVRAGGLSGSSDSLWIEIVGATLLNAQGRTVVNNALYIITPSTGGFTSLDAGAWNLGVGTHTIRIWMRESGTAVDSITVSPFGTTINGATEFQAENFNRRVDSANHRWWIVDAETAGVGGLTGATGSSSDFIQSLNLAGADTPNGNFSSPAGPYVEYDIEIVQSGTYSIDVRAAGVGGSSDSLWIQILGAALVDTEGNPFVGNATQVVPPSQGAFTSRDAGVWNLPVGNYTIRVSMRESGTAVDSLTIAPVPATAIATNATTTIQGEGFSRRSDGVGHRWWAVDTETAGVGGLTGATGTSNDYIQALNMAGQDSPTGNFAGPAAPLVEYDISISAAGTYNLDVLAAGIGGSADSLFIDVLGGTLFDAEGQTVVGGALQIVPPSTGSFSSLNAGRWTLTAGQHTIRVWMRESGTALDAILVVPPAPVTQINGATVIQAESFGRRQDSASHRWWIVDLETPGVGSISGATGPAGDYLQSLTLGGADSSSANYVAPAAPYVDYDIEVLASGSFAIDLTGAGLGGQSDSLYVEVLGGSLVNAEGNSVVGTALNVTTPSAGLFTSVNGGVWSLSAGIHTIRIWMRESGTAFDSLTVTPL